MILNDKYTDIDGNIIDRFALEQAIHDAWHVVDDLRILTERLEYLNEDQIFAVVDVDVGATDPRGLDLDDHLSCVGLGFGHIHTGHVSGLGPGLDDGFHRFPPDGRRQTADGRRPDAERLG